MQDALAIVSILNHLDYGIGLSFGSSLPFFTINNSY